jgi:hypothetical protein
MDDLIILVSGVILFGVSACAGICFLLSGWAERSEERIGAESRGRGENP